MTALSMTTGWLLEVVPWWAWMLATATILAATYQIWAPIWGLAPRPIRLAVLALMAIGSAYVAGRSHGAANERGRQESRRANAAAKRQEIDNEVDALPDAALDRRLDRWMRD